MSTIRPGTLCVIEPLRHEVELPEVLEQLTGLVVVAVRKGRSDDLWEVNPKPVITTRERFAARGVVYSPGSYDVHGVPESYLRPLRGEPTAQDETVRSAEVVG